MSSLAMNPMDRILRRMLALSAGLHLFALFLSVVYLAWSPPPARFIPIAVVDLVGGAGFDSPAPTPPPRAAAAPEEKRSPAPPEKPAKRPAPPAKAEPAARAVARKEPDTEGLSERIRKMREEQSSAEKVREAVGTIRKERAAQSAVGRIRERVAHRVDLSAVRPVPKERAPERTGAAIGGAVGTSRVPPETLAYFRELDERIRSRWTVPDLAAPVTRELIVQIRITIERDGSVSNVRMEKSSGNPFFDDSVLRAIHKASPLPVPPDQLRGSEDHYDVGFRFFGAAEGR